MGMATYTDPNAGLTKWQRRAVESGLINFRGKRPQEMTDAECQVMFEWLRDHVGISYIWNDWNKY